MFAGGQCCLWRTEVSIRWSGVDLLLEGPSSPWHVDSLGPPLQGATREAKVGGVRPRAAWGPTVGFIRLGAARAIVRQHALCSAGWGAGAVCAWGPEACWESLCLPVMFDVNL